MKHKHNTNITCKLCKSIPNIYQIHEHVLKSIKQMLKSMKFNQRESNSLISIQVNKQSMNIFEIMQVQFTLVVNSYIILV